MSASGTVLFALCILHNGGVRHTNLAKTYRFKHRVSSHLADKFHGEFCRTQS